MSCEDFPCCGHEARCCPDFDESGRQLNMKCVCGAVLPLSARSSICDTCLKQDEDGFLADEMDYDEEDAYRHEDYNDDGYYDDMPWGC